MKIALFSSRKRRNLRNNVAFCSCLEKELVLSRGSRLFKTNRMEREILVRTGMHFLCQSILYLWASQDSVWMPNVSCTELSFCDKIYGFWVEYKYIIKTWAPNSLRFKNLGHMTFAPKTYFYRNNPYSFGITICIY